MAEDVVISTDSEPGMAEGGSSEFGDGEYTPAALELETPFIRDFILRAPFIRDFTVG